MSFLAGLYGTLGYLVHVRGRYDTAKKLYEKGIENGMKKPERIAAYAAIIMGEGKFEEAIELYNQALEGNTIEMNRTKIRVSRAICYIKTGKYEHAKAALEDIHTKYPSLRTYESLGYLYIMAKDEKAEEFNLEAYEYDSENYIICDNLCQMYLDKGDYENARKFGEKANKLEGWKVDNLYNLSLIELHDGNVAQVKDYLDYIMDTELSSLHHTTDEMRRELYKKVYGKEYSPEEE